MSGFNHAAFEEQVRSHLAYAGRPVTLGGHSVRVAIEELTAEGLPIETGAEPDMLLLSVHRSEFGATFPSTNASAVIGGRSWTIIRPPVRDQNGAFLKYTLTSREPIK